MIDLLVKNFNLPICYLKNLKVRPNYYKDEI
jgi:hypothetical protein